MATVGVFHSLEDPLRQRDVRERAADSAELIEQFCDGKLPVERWGELPMDDAAFRRQLKQRLLFRAIDLEKHQARFKALREVFGPERR